MSDTAGAADGQENTGTASSNGPGGSAPHADGAPGTDKGGDKGGAGGDKGAAGSEKSVAGGPGSGRDDHDGPDEYQRGQQELAAERARLNPLGVPDKFLDKSGRPDFAKLTNSYKEADKALMRKGTEVRAEVERTFLEERAKAAPATPADYTVEKEFVLGDRKIAMITDDPMLEWAREVAHANQWTQAQFDESVRGYVARQISSLPKWSAEAEKLGPSADARHARVDGFLRGNLSDETYKTFATMPATASLITAIEEVMELAGHPKITDDTTAIPRETLSRDAAEEDAGRPALHRREGPADRPLVRGPRARRLSRLVKERQRTVEQPQATAPTPPREPPEQLARPATGTNRRPIINPVIRTVSHANPDN